MYAGSIMSGWSTTSSGIRVMRRLHGTGSRQAEEIEAAGLPQESLCIALREA